MSPLRMSMCFLQEKSATILDSKGRERFPFIQYNLGKLNRSVLVHNGVVFGRLPLKETHSIMLGLLKS